MNKTAGGRRGGGEAAGRSDDAGREEGAHTEAEIEVDRNDGDGSPSRDVDRKIRETVDDAPSADIREGVLSER